MAALRVELRRLPRVRVRRGVEGVGEVARQSAAPAGATRERLAGAAVSAAAGDVNASGGPEGSCAPGVLTPGLRGPAYWTPGLLDCLQEFQEVVVLERLPAFRCERTFGARDNRDHVRGLDVRRV